MTTTTPRLLKITDRLTGDTQIFPLCLIEGTPYIGLDDVPEGQPLDFQLEVALCAFNEGQELSGDITDDFGEVKRYSFQFV